MAMEREKLKSVIESLMFVSEAILNLDRLSTIIEGVEKKEILSAIEDLQTEYENQERGIRLVEVGGGVPAENSQGEHGLDKNIVSVKSGKDEQTHLGDPGHRCLQATHHSG